MNIYKNIPYTYLIGWSKHNKWYYGVRYANNCNPSDLWVKYFTSSKEVKKYHQENGNPDIIEIRKTFKTKKEARLWEQKVLSRLKVSKNEKFLNKSEATSYMNREGRIAVYDYYGNVVDISILEFNRNRNKYKHFTDGKFSAKNEVGEIFLISKDDDRYLSGELVAISKGTVPVKDSNGKCFRVSINDGRYLSGELVHINKGKVMKNSVTSHMNISESCPICGKVTNKGNLARWHKHDS